MAYEQKDNEFSLFKNEEKKKESDADYTGNGMIGGKEGWFNAWINTAKNGKKYMKVKFKPKDFAQKKDPISTGRPSNADMNDEIPF